MYRRTAVNRQEGPGQSCCPDPSSLWPAAASVVLVFAGPRLSRSPEPLQSLPIRRFAQLLKCAFPNLPNSFTGDAHQRADLLQRHRLAALFESVVEIQNLALARREILLEDAIDELAHQLAVGALFDLAALLPGEALAKRRRILVGAIDRRVERQLRRRHAARGAYVLDAVFQRLRDFVVRGFPAELLRQIRLGAARPAPPPVLV